MYKQNEININGFRLELKAHKLHSAHITLMQSVSKSEICRLALENEAPHTRTLMFNGTSNILLAFQIPPMAH